MTLHEIENLVREFRFASIGFLDKDGNPSIRKVFSTWHKGLEKPNPPVMLERME